MDLSKFGTKENLSLFSLIKKKNKWYLNNDYSRHMIGDSNMFIKLERLNEGSLSFGGNNKGKIIGKRTVKIGRLIINNVSWVEGLNYNLISISQLFDIGFQTNFLDNMCSCTNKGCS